MRDVLRKVIEMNDSVEYKIKRTGMNLFALF